MNEVQITAQRWAKQVKDNDAGFWRLIHMMRNDLADIPSEEQKGTRSDRGGERPLLIKAFTEKSGKSQPWVSMHTGIAESWVGSYSPVNNLPTSYSILYTLAKLKKWQARASIRRGEIRRNMTRNEAAEVLNIWKKRVSERFYRRQAYLQTVETKIFLGNILLPETYRTQIKPESIDAIITDPPRRIGLDNILDCWRGLFEFADYALRPDGFLWAIAWTSYIPELFDIHFTGDYETEWLRPDVLTYKYPFEKIEELKLIVMYRPILVFKKSGYTSFHFQDEFDEESKDQGYLAYHVHVDNGFPYNENFSHSTFQEWMVDVLADLTIQNMVVSDPFAGGLSTAVACKYASRRFIGFDIDKKRVRKTRRELAGNYSQFLVEK